MALEQPSRKARFAPARPGSFGRPSRHTPTMNGYIAMALAIFGLGSGIGKVLTESTRPVMRRWGRALELATPIVVGAVAVMGVILLGGDWYFISGGVFVGFVGLAIGFWFIRDAEKNGWINPTE